MMELMILYEVVGVPGCIQLIDWFEDYQTIFYVMERFVNCVDMFCVVKDSPLDEIVARNFFRQIVKATMQCHYAGVLHNDLKIENVLVDLDTGKIKLIDFGAATLLRGGEYTESPGTELNAPPEWFAKRQYEAIPMTVWTLGLLLYIMVCDEYPFGNAEETCGGRLQFPETMSSDLRHLLEMMLSVDPEKRPILEDIIRHPWLNKKL